MYSGKLLKMLPSRRLGGLRVARPTAAPGSGAQVHLMGLDRLGMIFGEVLQGF